MQYSTSYISVLVKDILRIRTLNQQTAQSCSSDFHNITINIATYFGPQKITIRKTDQSSTA